MTNRRDFLKQSLLATAGTMLVPNFLKALERPEINAFKSSGKILVVVQLSGGNDGLNTVVPYRNDIYYKSRPQLAIPADKVLKVSDELGFHPALDKLQMLYDQGYLSILNNVGYPNPDRSHFRSMDIWQTASHADEYLQTGWIGRYLDNACSGCSNAAHRAIEVDDTLSLALKGEQIKGMAMKNPKKLHDLVRKNFFQEVNDDHVLSPDGNASLDYLYKTLAETSSSAEYLYDKTKIHTTSATYPDGEFATRLKTIAQLIGSDVDTQVYYVSLSGFDTHVRQQPQQEKLLSTYAESVYAFVRDLEKQNRMQDVAILTFSEFGRRVSQNASGGTDHGTANNVFVVSKSLRKKGFLNDTPDLTRLDQGDLIYQVDFRSVYATLLNRWLEAADKKVLQGSFATLDFI
jgi:uncharacterized protein (DUF1501 family)